MSDIDLHTCINVCKAQYFWNLTFPSKLEQHKLISHKTGESIVFIKSTDLQQVEHSVSLSLCVSTAAHHDAYGRLGVSKPEDNQWKSNPESEIIIP